MHSANMIALALQPQNIGLCAVIIDGWCRGSSWAYFVFMHTYSTVG